LGDLKIALPKKGIDTWVNQALRAIFGNEKFNGPAYSRFSIEIFLKTMGWHSFSWGKDDLVRKLK